MKLKGFTLIEILVAISILSIALLGILPLYISNIKLNEANQRRLVAQKILEDIASELRTIKVYNFNKDALKTLSFHETLPSNYPPVTKDCPSGFEYSMFKGYELYKYVRGNRTKYKYTIKLCVDDDYLKPYLKRVHIWVYWLYNGRQRKTETEVFITGK